MWWDCGECALYNVYLRCPDTGGPRAEAAPVVERSRVRPTQQHAPAGCSGACPRGMRGGRWGPWSGGCTIVGWARESRAWILQPIVYVAMPRVEHLLLHYLHGTLRGRLNEPCDRLLRSGLLCVCVGRMPGVWLR